MRNSVKIKPEKWTVAIRETVASFVFVILYFFLIVPLFNTDNNNDVVLGAFIFVVIYFLIGWYFKPRITIHILPVISFIKALKDDDFKGFFLRITGQLIGAFGATFLLLLASNGQAFDYSGMIAPLNPFLTAIFTAILSQLIYLAYVLAMKSNQTSYLRFFFVAASLGLVFIPTAFLEGLTLLNPFGYLLDYLITSPEANIIGIFIGILIHAIIPMLFLTGTHFYAKYYLFKAASNV